MNNCLKQIRLNKNLALRAVAAKARVSATTLCDIEKYDYRPLPATKHKIAAALGVDVTQIWPSASSR